MVPTPHYDTDQPRIVYLVRLISIWYCKWFMLFMTQLSWVSASHRDKAQDAFIYVKQRPAGPILNYSWRRAARLTRDRHRLLDNPKFFRQSQQRASTAYCLTHASTRTIGSPASQCQVLGYSRCCKCSFIKCTRGISSRQSIRSTPQVTQPVDFLGKQF